MATWILTRGLMTVRTEFNLVFKIRDKRSDGSIGDQAHATGTSGHNPDRTGRAEYKDGDAKNEVRAIDVDRDLVPGSGIDWMERVVQYIVKRARAGHYVPFRYIIYKRRIWTRSSGWQTRAYTGANAHDQHAHFSGDYTQKADEWTGSLGLASLLPSDSEQGTGANQEEDEGVARQDVADYVHAVAQAVRGEYDEGTTSKEQAAFRVWRDDLAATLRFGWGLTFPNQKGENLAPARFNQLALAIAGVTDVDESALAAALAPHLGVTQETVEAGLRAVLQEGVGTA